MRFQFVPTLLALAGTINAASQWGFSDATVSVTSKGDGQDVTEKFTEKDRVSKTITLGPKDTIKVALTTKEGSKAKRAHQTFLVLKESSGLEAPFPLTVKDSGKGTVEITQRDLPVQLLTSSDSLEASLIVGSFGSTAATVTTVFDVHVNRDPNAPSPAYETPIRYGKQPEIHHIFRADPKSPPKVISSFFVLIIMGTVPVLFASWAFLDGNLDHATKALSSAPVSHALFFGSIISMEIVFFFYYAAWNLFQTLPVMAVVSVVAFLSGSKALSEVQSRRLAGER